MKVVLINGEDMVFSSSFFFRKNGETAGEMFEKYAVRFYKADLREHAVVLRCV